ncbi:hypothetical protein FCM35_KLT17534 [Carex littledalei]|uniref:Uncharacterized protein n=1 Tax=Carex littledalei TaxID=544730 RepID=A0A833VG97_9POAL|nr:hypothetical protein FCM35_KLT17534 [Carex littledalei]
MALPLSPNPPSSNPTKTNPQNGDVITRFLKQGGEKRREAGGDGHGGARHLSRRRKCFSAIKCGLIYYSALYHLHLVKAETARSFIPKEFRLVEAFGYKMTILKLLVVVC